MSKFIRQFRSSFQVGDVLACDTPDLRWRVDYIGAEAVVMTDLSQSLLGECVFWERVYAWRKVKQ